MRCRLTNVFIVFRVYFDKSISKTKQKLLSTKFQANEETLEQATWRTVFCTTPSIIRRRDQVHQKLMKKQLLNNTFYEKYLYTLSVSISLSPFKIHFILSNTHFLNAAVLIFLCYFSCICFGNSAEEISTTIVKYIKNSP